jgi:hypothetical protein
VCEKLKVVKLGIVKQERRESQWEARGDGEKIKRKQECDAFISTCTVLPLNQHKLASRSRHTLHCCLECIIHLLKKVMPGVTPAYASHVISYGEAPGSLDTASN